MRIRHMWKVDNKKLQLLNKKVILENGVGY